MYDESMDGVHDFLLKKSSPNGFLYVTDYDINTGSSSHKMVSSKIILLCDVWYCSDAFESLVKLNIFLLYYII